MFAFLDDDVDDAGDPDRTGTGSSSELSADTSVASLSFSTVPISTNGTLARCDKVAGSEVCDPVCTGT